MPPKKNSGRPGPSRGKKSTATPLKLWLAGLFLVGFLLGGLLLLGELRRWYLPPTETPSVSVPLPPARVVTPAAPLEDLRVELDSLLLRSGLGPKDLTQSETATGWVAEITAPPPAPEIVAAFVERLRHLPGVTVEAPPRGDLKLFYRDQPWGTIRFRPRPAVTRPASSRPRLAIIVDDLGHDAQTMRELLTLDLPLTFAILPEEPQSTTVATLAHQAGREVLIHLPMEPQGYPAVNPGRNALLVGAPAAELRDRFRHFREQVPFAVGGNNHMGSRFTEVPEAMAPVLGEMLQAGMFFVDSRTTSRSVAFDLARQMGLRAAKRDVFLDNVQDEAAISEQVHQLVKIARQHGQAIGICHPHAQTLAALRREAGSLRGQEVELVPVSRLLQLPSGDQ